MDKLFGSQCRVFRLLPFKVVFVQFDQKIGDALVFNHTLKLEIDFFSHSSKNSQKWAGKAILEKRLPVQSSRSLNRGSRNDCQSTSLAKSDPLRKQRERQCELLQAVQPFMMVSMLEEITEQLQRTNSRGF